MMISNVTAIYAKKKNKSDHLFSTCRVLKRNFSSHTGIFDMHFDLVCSVVFFFFLLFKSVE